MINIDIQGVLFPNLLTMLVQLCSTGILFLAVRKYLWEPARKMLEARSEKMQEDLKHAEELKVEADKDRELAKSEIKEARNTSVEILSKAKADSEVLRTNIVNQAKKEAELKIETANREIEYSKKQAEESMVKEMVSIAMAATEKLIGEKANASEDQKAIENFVKQAKDYS